MIGIYINACGEDTDFPAINEAKELGLKPVVFINELSKIRDMDLPVLHAADIWKFDGTVVATCEKTTRFLQNIPTPEKKFTLSKAKVEGVKNINSIEELNGK